VLVDSEPISNRVLAGLLTDVGLPMTPEQSVEAFMGRSWKTVAEYAEGALGHPLPDGFRRRYLDAMFAAFETELAPVPGVIEALDAIDLPSCVASSGSHEKMRVTLGQTGLLDRFTQPTSSAGTGTQPTSSARTGAGRIFSATEVEHGKPAPDLFLHAAERMGWAPADCAVVEDSPAGVEAALAAGMTALGYAGTTRPDRLPGARVFTDMADLPALLQSLPPA
jgi:beta-phosphoglucomutase-like phosphatase (HAD superfamily)